jgi:hypothetical protein
MVAAKMIFNRRNENRFLDLSSKPPDVINISIAEIPGLAGRESSKSRRSLDSKS